MNVPIPSIPNDLLQQLDDITGLHPVSIWPLAPGWWALIAAAAVLTGMVIVVYVRRHRWNHSWRRDAVQSLSALDASLNDGNAPCDIGDFIRSPAAHSHP